VLQFNRKVNGQSISYQVVFFETTNKIQFNYRTIASLGEDLKVAGIENGDGTVGLRYVPLDEADALSERSVLFYRGDPPEDPEPDSGIIYMPLLMADNWQTSVILLNDSEAEITGVLSGYDSSGEEVAASAEIRLASRARFEGSLDGIFAEADISRLAYLSFAGSGGGVVGSVHLQVPDQGMTGAYPALSAAAASETLYLPSVIVGVEGWGNIVSLVNVSDEKNNLEIEFDNGAKKYITLQPGQQFYVDQNMEVFSDKKLVVLKDMKSLPTCAVVRGQHDLLGAALYYQGEKLSALALAHKETADIVYPYLLDSAGWWSGLAFYNSRPEPVDAALTGYDNAGSSVTLEIAELTLAELQNESLPSHDIRAGKIGWLKAQAEAPITGTEFFGTADGKQLAAVATDALQGSRGLFSHIRSGEDGGWSGLLLINPGTEEVRVTLTAYAGSGVALAETEKTITARGQLIAAVTTLFPGIDKSVASVRFVVAGDENIVGMIFNGRDYQVEVKGNSYFMEELEALPPLFRGPEASVN
jgi:hypothetical protein